MKSAAAAGLLLFLLPACSLAPLRPEDIAKICRVDVEVKPEAYVYVANSLAHPVGGPVLGTLAGALMLPVYGPLAIVGPIAGIQCGAAAVTHPDGEAAFRTVFESADSGAVKRALDLAFEGRSAECRRARPASSSGDQADTILRIERIAYQWTCPEDKQRYRIEVLWRAQSADGRYLTGDVRTNCQFESARSVADWSADASGARLEADLALAKAGERMAREMLDLERTVDCRHVPGEPAPANPK